MLEDKSQVNSDKSTDFTSKTILVNLAALSFILFLATLNSRPPLDTSQDFWINFAGTIGFLVPAALVGGIVWFVLGKTNYVHYAKKSFVAALWAVSFIAMLGQNGVSLFGKSGNYEECLLESMKGQLAGMFSYAKKACELKHPFEKELKYLEDYDTSSITIGYRLLRQSIKLTVKSNTTDNRVTRAIYKFSKVNCDSAKDEDYTLKQEFDFGRFGNTAEAKALGANSYVCRRTVALFGKRIK